MKTKSIKQTIVIKSSPIKVYEAFMNDKKHKEFTGFDANIENKVGGKFITCGHRNFGYTLFLIPGERIVQAWSHEHFPNHEFTIINIDLEKIRENKTRLIFHQLGIPADCVEWLISGWKLTYWRPLKYYLEKGIIQTLQY